MHLKTPDIQHSSFANMPKTKPTEKPVLKKRTKKATAASVPLDATLHDDKLSNVPVISEEICSESNISLPTHDLQSNDVLPQTVDHVIDQPSQIQICHDAQITTKVDDKDIDFKTDNLQDDQKTSSADLKQIDNSKEKIEVEQIDAKAQQEIEDKESDAAQKLELESDKIFDKVQSFVDDLFHVFGPTQKPLQLFYRLMSKSSAHTSQRTKYVNLFRTFCIQNQQAIQARSTQQITSGQIEYEKLTANKLDIRINLKHLLTIADSDAKKCIWDHLQTLLACFNPSEHNLTQLQIQMKQALNSTSSNNVVKNVVDSLNSEGSSNPIAAVMSALSQNGALNQIFDQVTKGSSNGEFDMSAIFGTLQSVLGNIK